MSIKIKVIAILLGLALTTVLIATLILRQGIIPAFTELENELVRRDLVRVEQYINSELRRLNDFSVDWAAWGETQQFMLGNNPEFLEENLTDDAAYYSDVSVIALIDLQGQVVWGGGFDRVTLELSPLELYLPEDAVIRNRLLYHNSFTSVETGIVAGGEGLMLFASRPILDNSEQGPNAGTFFIATLLDDYFDRRIEELLAFDVGLWNLNEELPDALQQVNANLELVEASDFIVKTEDKVQIFERFLDVTGTPVLLSGITSPRDIYETGSRSVTSSLFLLLAALLVLPVACWFLLDKLIVDPLLLLQQHMRNMRQNEDLNSRLQIRSNDEFGSMAEEFDALTTKLRESRGELERARNKAVAGSESKSQFLATMSHELRTPMNGILGMAELLLATKPLTGEQQHYLKTLNQSGNGLLRILDDILDFSKIEAGKLVLEEAEFDIREVTGDSLELVANLAQSKGVELVLDVDPEMPAYFSGDAGRIRQLILNFLSNAVKFTEQGFIVLRARSIESANGEPLCVIEVQDTGIGIQAENQHKIFSAFSQEDTSTTRRFGGTGLGLAITRQLVELMKGDAGFSSTYGEGSTFWLHLPLHVVSEQGVVEENRFKGGRAILLSDNWPYEKPLHTQLGYWGLRTNVVKSNSELTTVAAFAFSAGSGPVFVFVDNTQLNEKCLNALRILRRDDKAGQLQIVILQPLIDALELKQYPELSPYKILNRPIRHKSLRDCIHSEEVEHQPDDQDAPVSYHGTEGKNVLLVEDNSVNVIVAESMLKKLDCVVKTATNGAQAVALCAEEAFDIVLMDCSMPVMDGFEATRKIREMEEKRTGPRATIVALTANAMAEDRDRCINAGMDGFLSKPITIEKLAESVSGH